MLAPETRDLIAVDWGTTRARAYLIADGAIVGRAGSNDGVSALKAGEHASAFARLCGPWLAERPDLPVALVGMVGSREGWMPAPYVDCPADAATIAAGIVEVELEGGGRASLLPGLAWRSETTADVMRGEETHLVGAGIRDGLIVLPGTHDKWALVEDGRILRFATFMTGEMHALLRVYSMIGRPAAEPADPAGFAAGLMADRTGGLLNALFGARAATLTGLLSAERLGPYLSGLLTAEEIEGALRLFGRPDHVTIVAEEARAGLYVEALGTRGIGTEVLHPETTFVRGVSRVMAARRG